MRRTVLILAARLTLVLTTADGARSFDLTHAKLAGDTEIAVGDRVTVVKVVDSRGQATLTIAKESQPGSDRPSPPRVLRHPPGGETRDNDSVISRSPKEFEDLVTEALDAMPAEFQERLENIVVTIEAEPSREDLDALHIPRRHTLFGLYAGTPLTQRDANFAALPDRIVLFRGPILRACDTPAEVMRQVRDTVTHEIGHFFGLSDADLP